MPEAGQGAEDIGRRAKEQRSPGSGPKGDHIGAGLQGLRM